MESFLKRYELFGWDYESINPLTEQAKTWYLKHLSVSKGPILELACGTARLAIEIARAGHDITGIDLSDTMLEIAKKKISHLPGEIKNRIRIRKMDMIDFYFEQRFGIAIIAENSFRELRTKDQQLLCLKTIHRHLYRNGKLLVTVRYYDPREYEGNKKTTPWSQPRRDPETGRQVMRKIETTLSDDGKLICSTIYYKTIYSDGRERIEKYPFDTPVMSTDDYISLFGEAGFSTDVYVDYGEKDGGGKGSILCFVCRKDEKRV